MLSRKILKLFQVHYFLAEKGGGLMDYLKINFNLKHLHLTKLDILCNQVIAGMIMLVLVAYEFKSLIIGRHQWFLGLAKLNKRWWKLTRHRLNYFMSVMPNLSFISDTLDMEKKYKKSFTLSEKFRAQRISKRVQVLSLFDPLCTNTFSNVPIHYFDCIPLHSIMYRYTITA